MKPASEYYIGWEAKAPDRYAKKTKLFVLIVILLVGGVAAGWVLGQRGFADSTFELGQLSTLEGTLSLKPAPLLKINKDGRLHSVLLIGFGKNSALPAIEAMESSAETTLAGKRVQLRGTLIYHNGKTLLELTESAQALVAYEDENVPARPVVKDYGLQSLKGEILDPKCALGVMKPGFGKPHRSCAIRCLSGGIPAVMRVMNEAGEENYCLVLGKDGEPINEELLPYVADQVRICGNLEQQDDWLVLKTDPREDLLRLQSYWMKEDIPMCVDRQ